MSRKLILASSSPFRRALLEKLQIPFECANPDIDESRQPGEAPEALVTRLAESKARALAPRHPDALIIGSDQVASLDDHQGPQILGKPGNHEAATQQLARSSGKTVTFHTGLCLLDARTGQVQLCCEPFAVTFRELTPEMIEYYLLREQPYGCAGSFKSEGLGITLFRKLSGEDPNALVGLPLIRLTDFLANAGIQLPLKP